MQTTKTLTILAHGDSDGVCSASVVKAAVIDEYNSIRVYFTHPVHLANDVKEFARGDLIILDVAIDEKSVASLTEFLKGFTGHVTYVDHHPPPLATVPAEIGFDEIVVDYTSEASASELTFRRFGSRLSRDYDRVALYGAIADYADATEWVRNSLERWDKRDLFFESGILSHGLEGARKLYEFKREIVDHLARNLKPSAHDELVKRAIAHAKENEELYVWVKNNLIVEGYVAYVINPPGSLGIAATYALGISGARIGLAAEAKDDLMVMSVRSAGELDLNKALRELSHQIEGSGGGHKKAAGARIRSSDFKKFLMLLNQYSTTPRSRA